MATHYLSGAEFGEAELQAMRDEGHTVEPWNKDPQGVQWFKAEDAPTLQAVWETNAYQPTLSAYDEHEQSDWTPEPIADASAAEAYCALVEGFASDTLPHGYFDLNAARIIDDSGATVDQFKADVARVDEVLAERRRIEADAAAMFEQARADVETDRTRTALELRNWRAQRGYF